ncbi:MAG TPA: hypothetical protein VLA19_08025 [Herpetosiphonaceae bacterium]|nr:hypothetical protein [Herpetosiphonaceae bacterium]
MRWQSEAGVIHAAQRFGRAKALREAVQSPFAPVDRADYDAYIAAARPYVDETTWQAAWEAGRGWGLRAPWPASSRRSRCHCPSMCCTHRALTRGWADP